MAVKHRLGGGEGAWRREVAKRRIERGLWKGKRDRLGTQGQKIRKRSTISAWEALISLFCTGRSSTSSHGQQRHAAGVPGAKVCLHDWHLSAVTQYGLWGESVRFVTNDGCFPFRTQLCHWGKVHVAKVFASHMSDPYLPSLTKHSLTSEKRIISLCIFEILDWWVIPAFLRRSFAAIAKHFDILLSPCFLHEVELVCAYSKIEDFMYPRTCNGFCFDHATRFLRCLGALLCLIRMTRSCKDFQGISNCTDVTWHVCWARSAFRVHLRGNEKSALRSRSLAEREWGELLRNNDLVLAVKFYVDFLSDFISILKANLAETFL